MNKKWIQLAILVLFVAVGAYTIGGSLTAGKEAAPKVGDRMPDFKLAGTDGQAHSIADFKGKPLIVNFWGTFCPPCVQETPALQRQYEKWKNDGLAVLGVNLDEEVIRINSFTGQYGVQYPIVIDKKLDIARKLGVFQYPTTFFVDKNGVIKDIFVGGMEEPYIEGMAKSLL